LKVYIFLPLGMGILVLQYLADILSILYNYDNPKGN
jgi:TRAP-type C4-dicarboxylate transport system permease small subunit